MLMREDHPFDGVKTPLSQATAAPMVSFMSTETLLIVVVVVLLLGGGGFFYNRRGR